MRRPLGWRCTWRRRQWWWCQIILWSSVPQCTFQLLAWHRINMHVLTVHHFNIDQVRCLHTVHTSQFVHIFNCINFIGISSKIIWKQIYTTVAGILHTAALTNLFLWVENNGLCWWNPDDMMVYIVHWQHNSWRQVQVKYRQFRDESHSYSHSTTLHRSHSFITQLTAPDIKYIRC